MDRNGSIPPADAPAAEELLQNQSECWLRGEPLPVEVLLQLYPNLQADRQLVLDLICHELLLRKRRGERPKAEDYLQRFPDFAADLRTQFEVQHALSMGNGGLGTLVGTVAGGRAAAGPPPERVADYEIIRELGRGGMGVVYLARHVELKRLVALKMIQSPASVCERQLARFRGEAEALARLQHPNVIQIYEVGDCAGRPFLALEYLPGGGLDSRLNGVPQSPRQAAQLLLVLVQAVGAAHEAGVIHRDLKPANILLAADDTPKITDFGLAKQLDAATGQTTTGDILGTPHYMAPEQAYGRRADVGPWTDIYALGAIFYELLTGRPPFNGASVLDTLEQIVTIDPVPPGRFQAKIPRDVEVICLKCLDKEPGRRYTSADKLADDLRRFLAGEPIRARPAPVWERTWKWVRRRPALAAVSGAVLLSILVLLGGAFSWLRAAASDARLEAREARDGRAAAVAVADLKDELHQIEIACDAQRWKQARSRLEGVFRQLDVAEQTFAGSPQIGDLRSRAEQLQRPIELQWTTRERFSRFRTLRTEAGFLVMGLAGTDLEARRNRAREVVGKAFELWGAEPKSGPATSLEQSTLHADEQREVREGCCEMLLGLAHLAAESPAAGQNSAEEALAWLDRATEFQASPGICHRRRARVQLRLGRDQEARKEEAKARSCPPVRATEFFLHGTDLYADNDLNGAVAAFEKALSLEPNHAAAAYALALPHLRLGQAARTTVDKAHLLVARMSLTACINQQPALPWPYLCRGFALGELGEYQAAEADYAAADQALAARPDDTARYALLVSRGALRIRRGQSAEAIRDLTEAVTIKPRDYQAYVNLARAYQLQQQEAKAVQQMDQAISLGPPTALAALYRTRARLHQEAGRMPAAVADLDEAARLEAEGPAPALAADDLAAKGRLLAQAQDYAAAVAAFDAALKARPDHPAALRARAEALLCLHRTDDALRDLNRLLASKHGPSTDLVALYRVRAGVRAKKGDHLGAIEDFTVALSLEPDLDAHVGRGWSYLALNAPDLAQHDFDRAVVLHPKDGDAHNGLAQARIKQGKYRAAVESAEQALRLGPATAASSYGAARVFAQASLQAAADAALPNAQRRDLGLLYQDRAVAVLRDALAALPSEERGRFWSETVQRDAVWNSFRPNPGFQQLISQYAAVELGH